MIGVIAVLAVLSIVGYGAWRRSVTEAAMKSDLHNAASSVEIARQELEAFPLDGFDLEESEDNVLTYVARPNGYCITATNPGTSTMFRIKSSAPLQAEAGDCTPTVSTIAGSGAAGNANGPSASATFNGADDVAIDTEGDIYIVDRWNRLIRMLSPSGIVSTFAGSSIGYLDGPGATAQFDVGGFTGITIDSADNLYTAANGRIRKITPGAVVSTISGSGATSFADGSAATAAFNLPGRVTIDRGGNIYVSDTNNYRIRRITPDGTVSTLAGSGVRGFADGPGTTAQFQNTNSSGIAVDDDGNVYLADWDNHRIRKISPTGYVSTLAGSGSNGSVDGPGATAQFTAPNGIAIDNSGNLYVSQVGNDLIRKVTPSGYVTTIAGNGTSGWADGNALSAQFNDPAGITIGPDGSLYIADGLNHRIRKITW